MNDRVYTLKDFYFDLPGELIAQYPSEKREDSRLFVIKQDSTFEHTQFNTIGDYLRQGDVLVLNNTKVFPARILCRRESGGLVEIVLTQRTGPCAWLCVSNRTGRLHNGETLRCVADEDIALKVLRGSMTICC
jgi:S-adenosylmethionine:tRNA ribosyltransferase-isomerase